MIYPQFHPISTLYATTSTIIPRKNIYFNKKFAGKEESF